MEIFNQKSEVKKERKCYIYTYIFQGKGTPWYGNACFQLYRKNYKNYKNVHHYKQSLKVA
jgi:hypothetical protein